MQNSKKLKSLRRIPDSGDDNSVRIVRSRLSPKTSVHSRGGGGEKNKDKKTSVSFKLPLADTNNNRSESNKNQGTRPSKEGDDEEPLSGEQMQDSETGGGDGSGERGSQPNAAAGKEGRQSLLPDVAATVAAEGEGGGGEPMPTLPPIIKESLVSITSAKSRKISKQSEAAFQVWDKSGSLLSPAYLKGLTSRIVGNSQNLAEHKLLEVNLDIMRKQRAQVIHSWEARLKREQQIILNNKAEWEMRKMRGRKQTAKAKLAIEKAKEALQEAMSRPINRTFIHRFTRADAETIAELARGRNFMATNIRRTLHRFKDILARVGITGESERKNAEILLQMRDHLEGLSSFEPEYLRKLQQTLPPDSPPAAFDILIEQIKVNRREELLGDYEKAYFEYLKKSGVKAKLVNLEINRNADDQDRNRNNNAATDAMKEAMAQIKREAVAAQLYNQSMLLQSHPFVTSAILLGKEIPYGYGGLGNKGDKKKEDMGEIKVKKKAKEDSMDMFGMGEDLSGMNSMRDVFMAMNMVDTKDVTDRIGIWLEKMEASKLAAEETARNQRANMRREAALAALAGGAG